MKKSFLIVILFVVVSVYIAKESFEIYYRKGMSRERYLPPHSGAKLDEVEKSIGEKLTIGKKEKGKVRFGYAKEPTGIFMGSGPPVYVFDENDVLIDFTLDQGDDLRFREKWYAK